MYQIPESKITNNSELNRARENVHPAGEFQINKENSIDKKMQVKNLALPSLINVPGQG